MNIKKINEELNKFLKMDVDEAVIDTMNNFVDILKDEKFAPISIQDIVKDHSVNNAEELRNLYKIKYNEFINNLNNKISNELGIKFPTKTWNYEIKKGKIYTGAPKEKGGIPSYSIIGGIPYYYEITKNGVPFTQVKDKVELIQKLQNLIKDLGEAYSKEFILPAANALRYFATNADLSKEDVETLIKASIILEDQMQKLLDS